MEAVEAYVIGSDFEDYLRVPIGESDTAVINQMYERIFWALTGCLPLRGFPRFDPRELKKSVAAIWRSM
jgi:hypothetical protein